MMPVERDGETARRIVDAIAVNCRVRFEAWLLEHSGTSVLWILLPDENPDIQLRVFREACRVDPAATVDLRVTDMPGEISHKAQRVA